MNCTKKLYDEAPYERAFSAEITEISQTENGFAVVLNETLFFPEEGGQCCDKGTINGVAVTHVSIDGGKITHICSSKPGDVGETVNGEINFAVRFRNMQHHTAEHIVSGIVNRLYSYQNVGFHLGSDCVTMDYDGEFTPEMTDEVEKAANEAVMQNLAVSAVYYTHAQAAALSYRSKKELCGDIRIVTIPGVDVCACCAPHVAHTGEIGAIKLLSAERYKGGTRISMIAGRDALRDYAEKHAVLSRIAASLSVKPCDAYTAVSRLHAENESLGAKLTALQKNLCRAYADAVPNGTPLYLRVFSGEEMNANGLKTLADLLLPRCRLCALFIRSADGLQFLLASSDMDIRAVYNRFAQAFSAKGGGRQPFVSGKTDGDENEITDYFNMHYGI